MRLLWVGMKRLIVEAWKGMDIRCLRLLESHLAAVLYDFFTCRRCHLIFHIKNWEQNFLELVFGLTKDFMFLLYNNIFVIIFFVLLFFSVLAGMVNAEWPSKVGTLWLWQLFSPMICIYC